MKTFDHHLHTSRHSPDSVIDPSHLLEIVREIGLGGVVITEHDYQWEDDELGELAARAPELRIFSGAEVSAREGHFLVYGLPNLDEAPPGILLKDLLTLVRRHQAAIIAAHPFRWDQDFNGIVEEHGPVFDALELVSNNVTIDTRAKTERLLARHPMGRSGSSDGHDPETVGCYFSEFPLAIETMADFVKALRGKMGRPKHRKGAKQASGPI